MQVMCRCGQAFLIPDERYPYRVCCHLCGRKFNVLDDGVTFDETEAAPIPSAQVDPGTIQVEPVLSLPSSDASSFVTERMRNDPAQSTAEAKLKAELRLIDLLWKTERQSHSLDPLFGIMIRPSKKLSVIVGLEFLVGWSVLIAIALSTRDRACLCPGTIGIAVSVFFPAYIYRSAHAYEKAESEWQSKRALAIAKSGLPAPPDS